MNGNYLRELEVDSGNLLAEEQVPGSHGFQRQCGRHARVGRVPCWTGGCHDFDPGVATALTLKRMGSRHLFLSEEIAAIDLELSQIVTCLLYTSPSPRDGLLSRMPSS